MGYEKRGILVVFVVFLLLANLALGGEEHSESAYPLGSSNLFMDSNYNFNYVIAFGVSNQDQTSKNKCNGEGTTEARYYGVLSKGSFWSSDPNAVAFHTTGSIGTGKTDDFCVWNELPKTVNGCYFLGQEEDDEGGTSWNNDECGGVVVPRESIIDSTPKTVLSFFEQYSDESFQKYVNANFLSKKDIYRPLLVRANFEEEGFDSEYSDVECVMQQYTFKAPGKKGSSATPPPDRAFLCNLNQAKEEGLWYICDEEHIGKYISKFNEVTEGDNVVFEESVKEAWFCQKTPDGFEWNVREFSCTDGNINCDQNKQVCLQNDLSFIPTTDGGMCCGLQDSNLGEIRTNTDDNTEYICLRQDVGKAEGVDIPWGTQATGQADEELEAQGSCVGDWCWVSASSLSSTILSIKKPNEEPYDVVSNNENWVECRAEGLNGINQIDEFSEEMEKANRFYCYQHENYFSWAECVADESQSKNGDKSRGVGDGLFEIKFDSEPARGVRATFTDDDTFYGTDETIDLIGYTHLEFLVKFSEEVRYPALVKLKIEGPNGIFYVNENSLSHATNGAILEKDRWIHVKYPISDMYDVTSVVVESLPLENIIQVRNGYLTKGENSPICSGEAGRGKEESAWITSVDMYETPKRNGRDMCNLLYDPFVSQEIVDGAKPIIKGNAWMGIDQQGSEQNCCGDDKDYFSSESSLSRGCWNGQPVENGDVVTNVEIKLDEYFTETTRVEYPEKGYEWELKFNQKNTNNGLCMPEYNSGLPCEIIEGPHENLPKYEWNLDNPAMVTKVSVSVATEGNTRLETFYKDNKIEPDGKTVQNNAIAQNYIFSFDQPTVIDKIVLTPTDENTFNLIEIQMSLDQFKSQHSIQNFEKQLYKYSFQDNVDIDKVLENVEVVYTSDESISFQNGETTITAEEIETFGKEIILTAQHLHPRVVPIPETHTDETFTYTCNDTECVYPLPGLPPYTITNPNLELYDLYFVGEQVAVSLDAGEVHEFDNDITGLGIGDGLDQVADALEEVVEDVNEAIEQAQEESQPQVYLSDDPFTVEVLRTDVAITKITPEKNYFPYPGNIIARRVPQNVIFSYPEIDSEESVGFYGCAIPPTATGYEKITDNLQYCSIKEGKYCSPNVYVQDKNFLTTNSWTNNALTHFKGLQENEKGVTEMVPKVVETQLQTMDETGKVLPTANFFSNAEFTINGGVLSHWSVLDTAGNQILKNDLRRKVEAGVVTLDGHTLQSEKIAVPKNKEFHFSANTNCDVTSNGEPIITTFNSLENSFIQISFTGSCTVSKPILQLVDGEPILEFEDPYNKPSENNNFRTGLACCPTNYCWDGNVCVEPMGSNTDVSINVDENRDYRCVEGEWQKTHKRFDWNYAEAGFCNEETDCLVLPSKLGGDAEKTKEDFYTLGEAPTCINDGEFLMDNYCEAGTWTSRTKFLANELVQIAGNEYSIACGNFRDLLPDFSLENDYPGAIFIEGEGEGSITTKTSINPLDTNDGTVTKNIPVCFNAINQNLNKLVPAEDNTCINNVCILKNEKGVIMATTLNKEVDSPQSFLKALNIQDVSTACADGQDFTECVINVPGELFYSNELNSVVYSKTGVGLNPGIVEKTIEFLQKFLGIDQPQNVEFVANLKNVRDIYLAEKDGKIVRAVLEEGENHTLFAEYENFETPVCEYTNNIDHDTLKVELLKQVQGKEKLTCVVEDNVQRVEAYAGLDFLWPQLTGRLRVG
jgi:hypothetical protein